MSLFVREGYFYKRFFSLTAAIALQNVIVFGVNLADNIMLGAYSETALSGVALVNQIQFLLQMYFSFTNSTFCGVSAFCRAYINASAAVLQ